MNKEIKMKMGNIIGFSCTFLLIGVLIGIILGEKKLANDYAKGKRDIVHSVNDFGTYEIRIEYIPKNERVK